MNLLVGDKAQECLLKGQTVLKTVFQTINKTIIKTSPSPSVRCWPVVIPPDPRVQLGNPHPPDLTTSVMINFSSSRKTAQKSWPGQRCVGTTQNGSNTKCLSTGPRRRGFGLSAQPTSSRVVVTTGLPDSKVRSRLGYRVFRQLVEKGYQEQFARSVAEAVVLYQDQMSRLDTSWSPPGATAESSSSFLIDDDLSWGDVPQCCFFWSWLCLVALTALTCCTPLYSVALAWTFT
jgi:hypothetical protein